VCQTHHVQAAFMQFGLLNKFAIRSSVLEAVVEAMRNRYDSKAWYHNWVHAICTMQASFLFLQSWSLASLISDEDTLGLLLGSLGHDIEHMGVTNAFLVHQRHPLALLYNDLSVLENHHASVTNQILESQSQVRDTWSSEAKQRIRLVIVKAILGTDMKKHKSVIELLEANNVDLVGKLRTGETLSGDDALDLGEAVVHCADLSHSIRPWSVHKHRSHLIATEFYLQFQEETRLSMPTMAFMGKDPNNLQSLAPIQSGFLQFVAAPLWSAITTAVGGEELRAVMDNLDSNRDAWKQLGEGIEEPDVRPYRIPASIGSSTTW